MHMAWRWLVRAALTRLPRQLSQLGRLLSMFDEGKNIQRRLEQDGQGNLSESRRQWRNYIDFYKSLVQRSVPADVPFGMQTVL